MALESVDLLSLLKRARKSSAEPVHATGGVVVKSEHRVEPHLESRQPAIAPPPVAKIREEEEELADLRAELFADEVLLQRILGLLYRCKKKNPGGGFLSILDMEKILCIEREGAAFVMAYMKTQKVIEMDDKSRMAITVPGIVYLRSVLGLGSGANQGAELDPIE
jgi:hypothetical protein